MSAEEHDAYTVLPRGGILIATASGSIQFGIPPETIKDTMVTEGGVPSIFMVPHYMFDITQGIALADIEFPIYYNFFIKQRKIRIICNETQADRLRTALQEALFGPEQIDLSTEFDPHAAKAGVPDLKSEMEHFRKLQLGGKRCLEFDDVMEFIVFDKEGKASVDGIEIRYDHDHNFHFFDRGIKIATARRDVPLLKPANEIGGKNLSFRPPLFGITTLGAGHGFDPAANTSGMIIWTNRRGVMVDPPVNSTVTLMNLGVSPKLIDNVVLTHCHADHDAGTLQKILQEGKLNLFTTDTIFESFMRKSCAMTGIEERHLRKLVTFYPVKIGQPMKISGGEFRFHYTLHSIPTISIQVELLGKSMIYSSDTMNDPQYINQIFEAGVIDERRRDFLLNFPWDKSVILHEAGIPPLHTPIDYLCTLPESTRRRTYLVHVATETIPPDSGLQIAPTGLANTLKLDVNPLPYDDAIEVLDVFAHIDIFGHLSLEKAREILIIAKQETFQAGDVIFREGEPGNKMYIIFDGWVEIVSGDRVITNYSTSDYFGEKSILLNETRTATARAKSEVRLFSIERDDLLGFIRGTESQATLTNLALIQDQFLRKVLHANRFFRNLTPTQETQLHSLMKPVSPPVPPGTTVMHENRPAEACYIISAGRIRVYKADEYIAVLKQGDLIDITSIFDSDALCGFTFVAEDEVRLYRIGRNALKQYLERNPGFYIKMYYYDYR